MIDSFTEWLKKWWFLCSAILIAGLWYLLDRRGRTIQDLNERAKLNLLSNELKRIKEDVANDQTNANKALNDYAELKRRHAELFKRLGIGGDKPNPPGNPSPH